MKQIKILGLKNTEISIKILLDKLNNRMEGAEERISKREDRSIEMIQYDKRENRPTKREQSLWGYIIKDLFMSLQSQKEMTKRKI